MNITKSDVACFKTAYCDENSLIAGALAMSFSDFMIEPIYDIGAGWGDISANAFPTRDVVHVDVFDYQPSLPSSHSSIVGDFFTFQPATPIGSLLLCHVLQFLDDNAETLHARILSLYPKQIVVVENNNNGVLGEIIQILSEEYPASNPEVPVVGFDDPMRYRLILELPITATVSCPDYRTLAMQVHYLADFPASEQSIRFFTNWLERTLPSPSFPIEQTIRGYKCMTI